VDLIALRRFAAMRASLAVLLFVIVFRPPASYYFFWLQFVPRAEELRFLGMADLG